MEAIKNSRIIVVLLILYIGISILVITLDNNNKKSKETNKNDTKENNTKYDEFLTEIGNISTDVKSYIQDNSITYDTCIKMSEIMGDNYSGSVYISDGAESIRMWYSNGTYAINNIEINDGSVLKEDVEDNYTTDYYNNCGLNE